MLGGQNFSKGDSKLSEKKLKNKVLPLNMNFNFFLILFCDLPPLFLLFIYLFFYVFIYLFIYLFSMQHLLNV